MSKANILSKTRVGDNIHVQFDAADGKRTYQYGKIASAAILKGRDPADFSGNLIEHIKPAKKEKK